MTTIRVAAVQHDIVWHDRDANFEHLGPVIEGAVAGGARLVLLTETFSTGFSFETPEIAEPEGGPSASFLIDAAVRHGVWVGGSCPEIAVDAPESDQRPSNSFVLAAPDGTVHRYAKIHPFSHAGEEKFVRAGTDHVVVDVDGFRLGLFVCYDLRFSDEFWALAHDVDGYAVIANWPAKRRHHWQTLLRARAIENQAYVVGVNRVGPGGGLEHSGDSMVIDPLGEVLVSGAGGETVLFADLDTEHVASTRGHFRFLQDRR
ncbi:MAG: nitrilase-related carbon-nitrogen hydrolase [Ilumatobacter sp.]